MRQISVLLVVALTVTTSFAYPASYEKDKESDTSEDAEYIVVPLAAQRPTYYNRYPSSFEGFDGVIDTGDFAPVPARPVYFPSYNPFSWHLSGYLDDILKRMRDRFAGSWNPFYSGIPSTVDFVPSGPGIWPSELPSDDSSSEDGTNTNSTSTVKVIDGHKVVINDTYYTKKTEYGTSIFKVRVIDVKPASGEGDGAEETVPAPKPEQPTEVDLGNRAGEDEAESKKPESTTADPTTRDTELESSDEGETPADDNLNTIDSGSDGDIDAPKAKEAAAPEEETDKTEVNTESSTDTAEEDATSAATTAAPSSAPAAAAAAAA
uniref:Putative salivary secreted mucin 3 n=2 Tax=Anopheles triannulatus TaxID=58253 RepID=A0A2M4A4S9_9DIPT